MQDRLRAFFGLCDRRDKPFSKVLKSMFGLRPNNIELYKLALVHRSASLHLGDGTPINNERLEFLGDSVMEAVVSDFLFIEYPGRDEGFLTQLRSKIVSRTMLNELALRLELDRHIVAHSGAMLNQKHLCGDVFEAMIGAIYLDKGYNFTNRLLINRILRKYIDLEDMTRTETDFKSRLIEWSQKNKCELEFVTEPSARYTAKNPHFQCAVLLDAKPSGDGEGDSKKSAEQAAARSAFRLLDSADEPADLVS